VTTLYIVLAATAIIGLLIWWLRREARNTGKQEAITKIRTEEDAAREAMAKVPPADKPSVVDSLRRGDF